MLGFSAKDVSGGEVGPAAQWYEAASDSDWSRYSATGDALRVVFIGGLRFRYTRLSKKEVSVPCRGMRRIGRSTDTKSLSSH
jgi:hypothetical protein